jgi:CRP/FNR family transcriptional regulator
MPGSVLRRSRVFENLSDAELAPLEAKVETRLLAPRQVLFREGDVSDALYIVETGQVEVAQGLGTRRPRVLVKLGPGEFFGELGVLDNRPRTATVTAITETRLVCIGQRAIQGFLAAHPVLNASLRAASAQRLCGNIGTGFHP